MNEYESRLVDLLDELEEYAYNRDKLEIWSARNKIMKLVHDNLPSWNKCYVRKADEEEKELYRDEHVWDGDIPEVGETVIIADEPPFLDIFIEFDDGLGFESFELINGTIYWMSLPIVEDEYKK
ncbi:hypothetical protein B7939_01155 [Eggerthia catenaformis]|nr:hypothetical protein B7939_01155 [Eggerthia catenaformis]